ncbi:MAG: dehydratase [Nitrospinae bacterium]|nr:dehydratase [Nitrospinota bacterium]
MTKKTLYYDDVNLGDDIPTLVKKPTTQQLVKYAGASGDYYQIHYDHHFAVNAGLKDGVIVHGLLTAGWMAQMLTDWLPSPMALKKFGVSYRAMARPGDTIACKGKIVNKYEKGGEHLLECEIAAENQRGEQCAVGTATVALPSRS